MAAVAVRESVEPPNARWTMSPLRFRGCLDKLTEGHPLHLAELSSLVSLNLAQAKKSFFNPIMGTLSHGGMVRPWHFFFGETT